MFNQIEFINDKWIDEQIELLSDTQLLIANINSNLGVVLKGVIADLSALDTCKRNIILKDHVFYTWLNEIKIELINAYETTNPTIKEERISSILNLLKLTICIVNKTELLFTIYSSPGSKILLPVLGLIFEIPKIVKENQKLQCKYVPNTITLEIERTKCHFFSFPQFETIKIAVNNFEFFFDPSGERYSISFDENITPHEWIKSLDEAFKIIQCDDSSSKLVKYFVSYLVPLKQGQVINNLSFSVRNLPNVVFKNNELNPYLIGETLVHEADHQFFYAIEKFYRFWDSDVLLQKPIYFSPWRDDPRPLDGILRGLSSFARVSNYYSFVLKTTECSHQQIDRIGTILLTRLTESEIALETILESKQLSKFGEAYIDEIQDTLIQVSEFAKSRNEYIKWRNDADEAINLHKNKWKTANGTH